MRLECFEHKWQKNACQDLANTVKETYCCRKEKEKWHFLAILIDINFIGYRGDGRKKTNN
jgi:hypothetical protein